MEVAWRERRRTAGGAGGRHGAARDADRRDDRDERPRQRADGPGGARTEESLAAPPSVYLNVENIEGEANPGLLYGVYVNLPEDEPPDPDSPHFAGTMSFFGIESSTEDDEDREEAPHGLRHVFDITSLVAAADASRGAGIPSTCTSRSRRSASRTRSRRWTSRRCGSAASACSCSSGVVRPPLARRRALARVAAAGVAVGRARRRRRGCALVRGGGAGGITRTAPGLAWWTLMVVAMMVPATIPVLRAISFDSMWQRRYRAPPLFVAAYLAVWVAFGAVALGAWQLAGVLGAGHAVHGAAATAAILLVAANWQLFAAAPPLPEALPPHAAARRARPRRRPRVPALRPLPRPPVRRRVLAAHARDGPRPRPRAHGRADGALELAAPRPPPPLVCAGALVALMAIVLLAG